jgi:hypothetical protein
MQKWQQWETGGEGAWGVALQRERVIRPLAEQPRPSAESVAEAACQLGLSRSVLYELLHGTGGLRPLLYSHGRAVASRMSPYSAMSAKLFSIPALMSVISGRSAPL